MSMVDNRVVRMTFDNGQFEKNLKTTMDSLSKFEKSLKLDGATAGFDALKQATDKLNLSVLGDKANKEAQRIDQMSSDAKKSIDSIDDAADNADFSALSKAAGDAVDDINTAADSTDFSPASDAAFDAATDINSAAGSVDLSPIAESAEETSLAFKALESVAFGVLMGIGNSIEGFVLNKLMGVKNMLLGPIKDGFSEYETQIGSIQTIIANTGMSFDSDEDIQRVNDALDELNTYADETIYNFTEMTRAIGTFTSSGLGLEEAKSAVQGAANVAALAGAGGSELTRVLPQLAQALSAGSVSQQDWMSIQTAHMDSRLFVEAIGDMAMHMAEAGKAEESAFIAGQRILEGANMRNLLNKVDSKDIAGWFSSDILAETLQVFTYDLDNMEANERAAVIDHLKELGYTTNEEIEGIAKLAKMAKRAATEVRTWSQLKDTLSEGIGSNWSGIWRNFIGDFKQATDTFTFLSNTLGSGIDSLFGGIVKSFQIFNRFEDTEGVLGKKGGVYRIIEDFWGTYERDENGQKVIDDVTGDVVRIKGAFDYLVEAIAKPLGAIKDAFDHTFGMSDIQIFQNIASLVLAFKDFAQSLVISDNAADGLRRVFEGLFSIIDIGLHFILDLGAAFFGVIKILRIFIDPLIDIALIIGGQLGLAVVWVHDKILELREAFIYMIYPIIEAGSAIGDVISKALGFSGVKKAIETVRYVVLNLLEAVWEFIDIPGKLGAVGDFLRNIFGLDSEVEKSTKGLSAMQKVAGGVGSTLGALATGIGGFFSAVSSVVTPVTTIIFNFLKSIASGIGSAALMVIGGLATVLTSIGSALFEVGKAVGSVISSGFPVFLDLVVKLGQAIGGFIGRLWDFFLAWEPINGIIQMVQDFRTKVVDFFVNIPNKISEATGKVTDSLSNSEGAIGRMVMWFESIISAINHLSPEEFVTSIQQGIFGISDSIRNFIDYLSNLNFEDVADSIMNSIESILTAVEGVISGVYDYLINLFPGIGTIIAPMLLGVYAVIYKVLMNIYNVIRFAKENAHDLPSFIGIVIAGIIKVIVYAGWSLMEAVTKIIGDVFSVAVLTIWIGSKVISDVVRKIFDSIKSIINGEGFAKLKEIWSGFGSKLDGMIKSTISNISPSLLGLYEKIKGFFESIAGESGGWSKAFKTAFDMLKEEFKDLPKQTSKTFEAFKTTVANTIAKIIDNLSNVSGPIGDFFTNIKDRISDSRKEVKKAGKIIPRDMKSLSEGIKNRIDDLGKSIKEFFVGTEGSDDGGFIGRLTSFFSTKAGNLVKKIKDIPSSFGDLLDSIIKAITPERLEKIRAIISMIAKAKMMKSLRELFSGLGKLSKAFARRMSKKDTESINEKMRDWAITFAIIGATLWVISTIPDPWAALGVVAGAGALLLLMSGVSAAIQKRFDGASGGKDLLQAAGALAVLAIAIRMMLKTVEVLNEFDYKANWKGILGLIGFLAAFVVYTKFLGNGGANAIKAAASLVVMAIALRLLIKPIEEIANFANEMSEDQLKQAGWALAGIAGFMVALGLAMRAVGKNGLKSGAAFVLMAFAVDIIADAITKIAVLTMLNPEAAIAAIGAIAIIMAEFAAIAQVVKPKTLLKAGASVMLFAASIAIISYAIGSLATIASANMAGALVSIGGIIAVMVIFGGMAKIVKPSKLIAAGKAMLMLSVSIGIIAIALNALAKIDSNRLYAAATAVGVIIGIFAILVVVLSQPALAAGASMILPQLSIALIALGAACLLIGIGLEHAVNGIIQLALASPILSMFVSTIAANVGTFLLAAVGIGALGAAFAIFGPTAVIAGAGIWLLANGIRDFLMLIIQLPILLPLAARSFGMVFDMIVQSAGGFVPKLAEWWNTTAWPWLQEKFAQAKAFFFNTVLPWLQTLIFQTIPTKLGEFIGWLRGWWSENAPQIIQKIGELKDKVIAKLQELLPKARDWLANEVIPKAKEKVADVVEKIKDKFGEKLKDFINDIPGIAQKALDDISESIKTLGENIAKGIAAGVAAGAHWVVTQIQALAGGVPETAEDELDVNSPSRVMRDRVGRYIPEGMAVGIRDFAGSVTEATKDLAAQTTNAIDSELAKARYSIPSPSISPVANMSDFANDISSYNRMLDSAMINGSVRLNNGLTGEMSLSAELASKLDADMSRSDSLAATVQDIQSTLYNNMSATADLYNRTNAILGILSSDASSIRESLAGGMNLYMDKGTLVGAIAPEMDDILGRRAILAGRGVY